MCLDAYPVFKPQIKAPFGGAQTMAFTLACALAKLPDVQVSVLVYDYGQAPIEHVTGVMLLRHPFKRMYAFFDRSTKLRRALYDRWQALKSRKSLKNYYAESTRHLVETIRADSFLFFGLSRHFLEIAQMLNIQHRRWAISLVHDEDVSEKYTEMSTYKNRHGLDGSTCFQLINITEQFFAQNTFQVSGLIKNFKKQGALLPTPIDLSNSHRTSAKFILWVARYTSIKRPNLFIELAKRMPSLHFRMITAGIPKEESERLIRFKPGNLELVTDVAANQIEKHFSQAKYLVNTSTSEGFPMTFLHAGKFGVPVLSLGIDPNEMLGKSNCGKSFESIAEMEHYLKTANDWEILSENISKYAREKHDSIRIAESLLASMIDIK